MKTMTYKGYAARIAYSDEDQCFIGHIAGIQDVVGFHGESVSELRAAFEEAVDDYLATGKALGKEPQTAASGRLMLRVSPEVHRASLNAAQAEGISLNQWAEQVLRQAAH